MSKIKEILQLFAADQQHYGNGEFGYNMYDAEQALNAHIAEVMIDELSKVTCASGMLYYDRGGSLSSINDRIAELAQQRNRAGL